MSLWRKFLGLFNPRTGASAAPANPDSQLPPAPEFERYLIPRQLVLLRPKAPYARRVHQVRRRTDQRLRQWPGYAHPLDNNPGMPTLADLHKDCVAYLIAIDPEYLDSQAMVEHVEYDFLFFFKRELEQWEPQSEGHWPEPLTLALALFRQWFEIESFDMVLDTAKV